MDRSFTLSAGPVSLRSIGPGDLEDLRRWKNDNKAAFFFKETITPEMQKKWFEGYLSRPDDFMFVVEAGGVKAGCMGFRLKEGAADVYNVIGAPEGRGKGWLGAAMKRMCEHIREAHRPSRIGCEVVLGNPAVEWYKKQGFRVASQTKDYYVMELA